MTPDERKDAFAKVETAARQLSEHFDSVHIFATHHISGEKGTVNMNFGVGNWFARYGQVKCWMLQQEEDERVKVRPE